MAELLPKDLFLQSLERCASDEGFIPAFYERFLASSDEVRKKFRFTDFRKQNQMLLNSLRLAAGATSGDPDSLSDLKERAETHSRRLLNIAPKLYDNWLESVIATAREFDPEWNDSIEAAWHTILGYVIKHMVRSY